ncbi:MAG: hypothetical protein GC151_07780 [Betaproteobacteria bacterium]|nr:hypothetical protein [Betaproteobacteria bacterium]
MHALDARTVLEVVDRVGSVDPCRAAVAIAAAASHADEALVATLPVAERDRQLLALQHVMFGPVVRCVSECPACRTSLDVDFRLDDLPQADARRHGRVETSHGAWRVTLRAPASRDLLAVAMIGDPAAAHRALFERLVEEALLAGEAQTPDRIPAAVAAAAIARLAATQPDADVEVALQCSDCAHAWSVPFDIAAYVAAGLRGHARELMDAVHLLASRYGWSEDQILALPPSRRQYYLAHD